MNNTTASKTSPKRRADLAMIHMAARGLFGDVSQGGAGRLEYEDWLERHTGKRSAAKLTTAERVTFIKTLRHEGLIADRVPGGTGQTRNGEDRPTKAQWAKMGGLARSMGWQKGLEDERLRSFVLRTAKVTSARFLTRAQANNVITGLERWARQGGTTSEADHDAVS